MIPSQLQRTLNNPFSAIRDIDRAVNRMWHEAEDHIGSGSFLVDVHENDDTLMVEADLPGFTKEQIDVSLEQGVLKIEAQRKVESARGKEHVNERRYTHVSRRFTLPSAYDSSEVDATLNEGVLTLKLNKREESKPRKFEIK